MTEPRDSGPSVGKNWLIGVLTFLTVAGGTGWMSTLHGQIAEIKGESSRDRSGVQQLKQDVEVAKERLRRVEEDTKEIKTEQRDQGRKIDEQGRKLDELLRRVR